MRAQDIALKAVMALPMLTMAGAASAVTGLGLAIDDSGSIGVDQFNLQRDAYETVLGSSLIPTDGSLAVGVWKFNDDVDEIFELQLIDSVADKDTLVSSVGGMTQDGGSTDIAEAISTASQALQNYPLSSLEEALIDVSTDGSQTASGNPDVAASTAISEGIDAVNCLGVTSGADCGFTAGMNSFSITVDTFADFEGALERKIAQETGQVPAPAPLGLLAAGLLAAASTRLFRGEFKA